MRPKIKILDFGFKIDLKSLQKRKYPKNKAFLRCKNKPPNHMCVKGEPEDSGQVSVFVLFCFLL